MNNSFDDNFKISLESKLKKIIKFSKLTRSNNNITIEEVQAAINKLNNLSAPGPDRICTLLIKEGGEMLLNLLRNILNQTYNLGYYPEDWKQENKIYLKKPGKDSYHDPKSYSPISLTNILGKILERIILNKILHHLESTNFFEGKNLFAYRRFFNTTHALLPLIEDMCDTISNGKIGASIMADLEGAFDATWRKGLMYKIYDNGITANLFLIINSYLENRRARNLVNNLTSDWFYTTKGLPQGSIISPILFTILTGDLSADPWASNSIIDRLISQSSTGNNSNTFNVNSAKPQESKFADDYNLWKTATNLPDLESNLQKDLDVLLEWCHKWRININIKKQKSLFSVGKKHTKYQS